MFTTRGSVMHFTKIRSLYCVLNRIHILESLKTLMRMDLWFECVEVCLFLDNAIQPMRLPYY